MMIGFCFVVLLGGELVVGFVFVSVSSFYDYDYEL